MERIKRLDVYQKGVLLFMCVMVLGFTGMYLPRILRVGFAYQDTILVPHQENGSMVYEGELQGEPVRFTVSEDRTVVFQYGSRRYGPYTAKEDPAAIPKDEELAERMTGVEICRGSEILFRGGVLAVEDLYMLYREDGSLENIPLLDIDENGIAPVEPTAETILKLLHGPELTHRGNGLLWFGAVLLCALNALSILFEEELFRWNLQFVIQDVSHAEPADWEILSRRIGWTIAAAGALIIFLAGME